MEGWSHGRGRMDGETDLGGGDSERSGATMCIMAHHSGREDKGTYSVERSSPKERKGGQRRARRTSRKLQTDL